MTEDEYHDAPKTVSDECERCDGEGYLYDGNGDKVECPECDGTGEAAQ